MNKQLLKAFIVKFDKTQAALAEAMGISPSCLNAKINENKTEFTKSEMVFIRKRYKLSEEEFNEIFLAIWYLKKIQRREVEYGARRNTLVSMETFQIIPRTEH